MIDSKDNYSSYFSVNHSNSWRIEEILKESEHLLENCDIFYVSKYVDIKRLGILNINIEYRIKKILRDYCERTK